MHSHLDGCTIECSTKHLKRSLLDVVFITYNLTVVISPNPIWSTINPACVLVWCNIYKHFSTKVTCAEVTGLQTCSHSSACIVRGLQSADIALCALEREVITQVDCYKDRLLLILHLRVSKLLHLILWMAFDPELYVLEMHCRHHRCMTQWRSPQLKMVKSLTETLPWYKEKSFKARIKRTQESRCAQPRRNYSKTELSHETHE